MRPGTSCLCAAASSLVAALQIHVSMERLYREGRHPTRLAREDSMQGLTRACGRASMVGAQTLSITSSSAVCIGFVLNRARPGCVRKEEGKGMGQQGRPACKPQGAGRRRTGQYSTALHCTGWWGQGGRPTVRVPSPRRDREREKGKEAGGRAQREGEGQRRAGWVVVLKSSLAPHPSPSPPSHQDRRPTPHQHNRSLSAMVSSSRRVSRKIHFSAPSALRRKIMSSALSKDLRAEHGVSKERVDWWCPWPWPSRARVLDGGMIGGGGGGGGGRNRSRRKRKARKQTSSDAAGDAMRPSLREMRRCS